MRRRNDNLERMKQSRLLIWTVAVLLFSWVGYRVYLAYADLVTLNVRDMDVRKVVPKLEWQTWEKIVLAKDVTGNVTLNVKRVPLTEVLNIIALQTSARWTALYPIYLRSVATEKFEKVVRGEMPATGSGWSNLEKAPAWRNGGGSMFGNALKSGNDLVSAQITKKDVDFVILALSRFAQAQVVPEDGTFGMINLKLDQAPFAKAVAAVAKQTHRKWDKVFTLQPRNRNVIAVKNVPPADTNAVTAPLKMVIDTNVVRVPKQKDPAEQERQMEAFLATMTPVERQKAEEQISTMQQMNALPPEERQQRMQAMAAQANQSSQADFEQRMQRRLRDGTTDQRIAHDREVLKRQQGPQNQQTKRQ
jgi:hypothetical protein